MKKKVNHSISFVICSALILFSAPKASAQLTALLTAIDTLENLVLLQDDSSKVYTYKALAGKYHELGNNEELEKCLRKGLTAAENTGSQRLLADAYHSFSLTYIRRGLYEQALHYAKKLLKVAIAANYPERISSAYNNIGKAHEYMGDFLAARKALLEAEKVNTLYGYDIYNAYEWFNIGMLNWRLHNFEEALLYFEKLECQSKEQSDPKFKNRLWRMAQHGKANLLMDQGLLEQAKLLYHNVIDYDPNTEIYNYNVAEALTKLGQIAIQQEQWEAAAQYLQRSIEKQQSTRTRSTMGFAKSYLAEVHLQQGQLDNALVLAHEAARIGKQTKAKQLIQAVNELLSRIHLESAQLDSAYHFQHLALIYKDSIFDVGKTRSFLELEAKYETQLQEQEILALKQQNQIQLLRNEKQQRQLVADGVALAILALVAILLYRLYVLKRRSNTKIQEQNEIIKEALEEKGMLMQEIHHRAKNNLHVIESLLSLQTKATGNKDAQVVLLDSKSRIQTIRLIHQQLYGRNASAQVDMREYLQELVVHLQGAFSQANIRFQLDVDRVLISSREAVPLGLFINEAITNSIKYAFPDNNCGSIEIALKSLSPQKLELRIQDDGVGFTHAQNFQESLGNFSLLRGLARQLEGQLNIQNKVGTTIHLAWSDKHKDMVNPIKDDSYSPQYTSEN
ncbi:MAG: hypothetical protein KTR30_26190 [Saprospiraceae bacterium]|nr:hypothetical protein [Saprospiraceae bacterium]